MMMPSRPGGDGTQGSAEDRWDRTQGVSFLDQCEGRLLTQKILIQVTCFATSHPPVICLTLCLHLFHLFRIRLLDSFLQNYDIVLENGSGDSFRKINLSGKVLQAGKSCSF